ncbi:hypothetical protein BXU06_00415 [Aquaspirillum sp. LM1]|uniref:hypothetical protein n=1 Tax=Aquaspirillum sp. LM1 TaxID=1938604 RepID=UPI000983E40E|nr:hypothetical protein [Aquaspirillum sp. LM1]AQR63695.1 hypothetical protein BXU06_00415 [Aquaspirillum sp. LM1]
MSAAHLPLPPAQPAPDAPATDAAQPSAVPVTPAEPAGPSLHGIHVPPTVEPVSAWLPPPPPPASPPSRRQQPLLLALAGLAGLGLAGWWFIPHADSPPPAPVAPALAPAAPTQAALPAPDPQAVSALLAAPAAALATPTAPATPPLPPTASAPSWEIRRDADLPASDVPDGTGAEPTPRVALWPGEDAHDSDDGLPAGWSDWQQASRAAAQGDWASALQGYQRAYAALPSQPERAFNLAVSLEQLGQRDAARLWYQHALSLTDAHSDPALLAHLHARLAVPEPRP